MIDYTAVSKPNFASKYALESSRRDLHNALMRLLEKRTEVENEMHSFAPFSMLKIFVKSR